MKKTLPDIDTPAVCARLKETRIALGYKKKNAFAELFGLKPTTYQNYEKDRMPPSEFLSALKLKFEHDVDIDWIVSGKKTEKGYSVDDDSESIGCIKSPDERFKHRSLARDIDLYLATIEKLNPDAFREVANYIKGIANGLQYSAKSSAEAETGKKTDRDSLVG